MKTNQKKRPARAVAVRSRSAKDIWQYLPCDYGRQRSGLGTWACLCRAAGARRRQQRQAQCRAAGAKAHGNVPCLCRAAEGGGRQRPEARQHIDARQPSAARQPRATDSKDRPLGSAGRRTAASFPGVFLQADGNGVFAVRSAAVPSLPCGPHGSAFTEAIYASAVRTGRTATVCSAVVNRDTDVLTYNTLINALCRWWRDLLTSNLANCIY